MLLEELSNLIDDVLFALLELVLSPSSTADDDDDDDDDNDGGSHRFHIKCPA